MELILLGIYSYVIWLIFFKFKWLPWNFVSQVIVVTIPIVGLTLLILLLNIVAPSSADVRVVNYVVAVNARVQGMVVDVPITPNQHIQKGQVLFRLDPRPVEIEISGFKAQIESLRAQLLSAGASTTGFAETVRNARGARESIADSRRGVLVDAATSEAFAAAFDRVSRTTFDRATLRAAAESFGVERFESQFQEMVTETLAQPAAW